MKVELLITHDWFRDSINVMLDWDLSHFPLPRIGERIHPSIWIDSLDYVLCEKDLSSDALESYNGQRKIIPNLSYEDWIYDICHDFDLVSSISYKRGVNKQIYVSIILE
ncbi:hypothetical protein [Parabacteroides sp. PF5-9]|uniref:hypothetical protein n=1 Tax=Parabacteroides sp. PF5-9 TaxID=1742404 RepID=UPI002474CEB9|nr:hypothetical protein [Parabacteroides sp. PF5-9]MDH6358913.1 hypothetical protein [Parabacteroides sp. PF5-9]